MANVVEIVIKATDNASATIGQVANATKAAAASFEAAAAAIEKSGVSYDSNAARANQLKLATLELAKTQGELANATDAMTRAQLQVKADKLTKEISDLSNAEEDAGKNTKTFGLSLTDLKSGIDMAVGAIKTFAAVAKGAFDFAQEGAAINATKESFDRLGMSIESMRAATNNTIPDMGLMRSTLTLMAGSSGVVADAFGAAMPQLLEMAKAANKLNPTLGDTDYMLQSIATAAKRQSVLIADNLGIVVKQEQAYQNYAKSIGVSVDALTNEQKTIAFLNGLTEAGTVLIEQAGGATESAADSYAQLTTSVTNAKDALKSMAAEALEPSISKWAQHYVALEATGGKLFSFKNELDSVRLVITGTSKAMEEYNRRLAAKEFAEDYAGAQNDVGVRVAEVATETFTTRDATNDYNRAMQSMNTTSSQAAQGQTALREALVKQQELDAATRSWEQVKTAMQGALGNEMASYAGNMAGVRDNMGEVAAKIKDLLAEQEKLPPSAQRYKDITVEIGGLQSEYDGLISKIGETASAHEAATRRIVFGFLEQRIAASEVDPAAGLMALQEVANKWGLIDDATLAAMQGVDAVVGAMEAGTIAPEQLADRLDMVIDSATRTPEALAAEQGAVEALTGAIPLATGALNDLLVPQDWLLQNSPGLYDALSATAGGLNDVQAAGMPAATAVDAAAAAASDAEGNFSGAAQKASDLAAQLDALTSTPVVIKFEFDIPTLPNIGGGGHVAPVPMASGFEGVFSRPTLAMFGEDGPEYVKAVPKSQMTTNNNSVGGDTFVINNGAQAAMIMDRRARVRALAGRF